MVDLDLQVTFDNISQMFLIKKSFENILSDFFHEKKLNPPLESPNLKNDLAGIKSGRVLVN